MKPLTAPIPHVAERTRRDLAADVDLRHHDPVVVGVALAEECAAEAEGLHNDDKAIAACIEWAEQTITDLLRHRGETTDQSTQKENTMNTPTMTVDDLYDALDCEGSRERGLKVAKQDPSWWQRHKLLDVSLPALEEVLDTKLRPAARKKALQAGVPEAQAELLADKVVSRLYFRIKAPLIFEAMRFESAYAD